MKPEKLMLIASAIASVAWSAGAYAQTASDQHDSSMPGMEMSKDAAVSKPASTRDFQAADRSMMSGMSAVPYTGNADRDFVAHMVPHHEGAIQMAEVELKYGKDAKLRALAREIIAAQKKEITFMTQWLAAHPSAK
jgi:uncharacterized protein (DUF305 family)